jgi:nucleotide-binding universal stress UspA family protein
VIPFVSSILVPVDFSERSAPAARYAHALASQFGAAVTLLHALAPLHELSGGETGGSMLAAIEQQRKERASADLDALAAHAGGAQWVVVEGDPAHEIVSFAHEKAGLIVMPTHGYGKFRQFILGSTTAKVLHDADCPVWTGVHLQDAPACPTPLRRILCAVDLGPQSSKTLFWAASLALEYGAALTLLHVTLGAPEAARHELETLRSFVHAEAEIRVETGEPAAAICAAAGRDGADALVIGRGSAAGVFGRLRASAYAIIRQSPCPVVSV